MAKSLENQISYYVQSLPPEQDQGLTSDQLEEWERLRNEYFWIGKCFRARSSMQDDPLEDIDVSPKIKEHIETQTEILIAFWAIVQTGFKAIQGEAKQYDLAFPFESAKELFCQSVYGVAVYQFGLCLRPYQEVSLKQQVLSIQDTLKNNPQVYQKGTKAYGRAREFRTYMQQIKTQGTADHWYISTIFLAGKICREKPTRYRNLQTHLNTHAEWTELSLKTIQTGSRLRGKWAEVFQPSFVWDKGTKRPLS